MERVLVSACLLGDPVRYDGTAATTDHPILGRWRGEGRIVPCCPEVAAGLPVPRACVELVDHTRALGRDGEDVTEAFLAGARLVLETCRTLDIRLAVLKERSPSCGSTVIYDGTFRGVLVPGQGLATTLLRQHGINVFSEGQWEDADRRLASLERR
jgi:uncharacterized protein YbbK (DUF523 family)